MTPTTIKKRNLLHKENVVKLNVRIPSFVAKTEETSHKKCFPLRLGVVLLIVFQILIAVLVNWIILWTSCQTSMDSLSDSLEAEISLEIRLEIMRYLQNASASTEITSLNFISGVIDYNNRTQVRKHLWTMINAYSSVSITLVGYPDGTLIGYERAEGSIVLGEHLTPGTLIGGVYNVDNNGNPVHLIVESFYNSTARPFYIEAEQAKKQIWSTVDEIPVVNLFGINSAFPIYVNGRLVAVVGTDLILQFISEFLSTRDYGATGSAMIVERSGYLIATSLGGISVQENGTLVRIQAVNSPFHQISETAQEIVNRYGSFYNYALQNFTFHSSQGTLFVTGSKVVDPIGIQWILIIIIPRSDWFSKFDLADWIALALAIFFLIISIIIALISATYITRPLRLISLKMSKIANLKINNKPSEKQSRLKEIASLQQSFTSLQHVLYSFLKYVPVEVVRILLKYNAEAVTGVEIHDVSLFFSDIADFTTISEKLDSQKMTMMMTEYLTAVSDIILQSNGTLADYIGDAVFAFWNAPDQVLNHPNIACEAALMQQEKLIELNKKWETVGLPKISVRMGIHTGPALCGNIGSGRRIKYTAIGDSVNLASRLEGLNKRYGTHILISDQVYSQVYQDFLCRALDVVTVKGRTTPTWIFEIISRMKDSTQDQKNICELSFNALKYYLQKEFKKSLEEISKLRHLLPQDKAMNKLREKCLYYVESPPTEDWCGVEDISEK